MITTYPRYKKSKPIIDRYAKVVIKEPYLGTDSDVIELEPTKKMPIEKRVIYICDETLLKLYERSLPARTREVVKNELARRVCIRLQQANEKDLFADVCMTFDSAQNVTFANGGY